MNKNTNLNIVNQTYRPLSSAAPPAATYYLLPITYYLFPITYSLKFSFSAKERDTETGLSYFGARYYSSDLSLWLSVDPMSGKYPHQSNYVYCSNNPIKIIDPNGEDEYDLARDGTLTKRNDGRTDVDIVHATDKAGEARELLLPVHTINQSPNTCHFTYEAEDAEGHSTIIPGKTDYMKFSDKQQEYAQLFFEFAAEYTDVEWAWKSSNVESYVGTSHLPDCSKMPNPNDKNSDVHSHPDDPGNYIGSDSQWALDAYSKGVTFKVYEVARHSYATYNPNSYKIDGPREASLLFKTIVNFLKLIAE